MLFNSVDFAVFLPIVFLLYWFVFQRNLRAQNIFLIAASYLFYAWWDWRFISLIIISSCLDWFVGRKIYESENPKLKKRWLWLSIVVDLGILGFFKYYNFFIENFTEAFRFFGKEIQPEALNIILPVGISFYTFQALSYSIDIYKGRLVPSKSLIPVAAYVAFFPQLMAGPIERATNLLPQFYKKREFRYDKAVDGLRQMLWGLFKKAVIADNCAVYVNMAFEPGAEYSWLGIILGSALFSIQVYCDFSGYSDMAIGMARLFGFNFKKNFAFPFFSRDIAEFWRRWHISLMSWFMDYLYIPLGGNRKGKGRQLFNLFVVFFLSGLWHGAAWTFVVFGVIQAFYLIPIILFRKNKSKHRDTVAEGRLFATPLEMGQMVRTFFLFTVSLTIFRSTSMSHGIDLLKRFFTFAPGDSLNVPMFIGFLVAGMFVIEWQGRQGEYGISNWDSRLSRPFRWISYYILIMLVFLYSGEGQDFIYFQF